jgi:hypothetical protein
MVRTPLIALFAALSLAQTAVPPPASAQPPAEVDHALRARIKAFYDLLVDRQYRKAEEIVAPDYRDFYYDRDKPRYLGYELTSIAYSPDFTRADVMVTVRMPPINPLMPTVTSAPSASIWRLLDGVWYWSLRRIDALDLVRSMAEGNQGAPAANAVPALPAMPGGMNPTPSLPANANLPSGLGRPEAMQMAGAGGGGGVPGFSMDRTEVALKPSTTEQVTIANTSSAPMTLFILGRLPGIEAAFDRPRIEPGEKAVLSIHAAAGAAGGALLIGVTETKAMITLPVTVR